jgi:hypothetical protein
MDKKYNEVVLLVHPLYRLLRNIKRYQYINNNLKGIKKITAKISQKLKGSFNRQYNNSISVYKKAVIETKKNKNSLFVVFEPKIPGFENSINQELYDIYIKNFYEFSKKALGNRFLSVSYDPLKNNFDVFDNRIYENLDKKIKIRAFGEYADKKRNEGCVIEWTNLFKEELKKRKITLISEKIHFNKSFSETKRLQRYIETLKSKYKIIKRKNRIYIKKRKPNILPKKPI